MRPAIRSLHGERRAGADAFGIFHIVGGHCSACDNDAGVCVQWDQFVMPADIRGYATVEATILKDEVNAIGLNCGCYGKLHRQVARISETAKRLGKVSS